MSVVTQTAAGHVTSTTTSGKYLNPEMIDLSEIYSKRTPLDLLIETCNNIGKDAGAQMQTGAKQRKSRNSPRDQSDHWNQSVPTRQQGTRQREVESGNAVVSGWCPSFRDNKGTRSDRDKETSRRIHSVGGDTVDEDGPEDLRLWSNRQSPDGSSMLNSPADSYRGRKSPSRDSLSSLSPSSHSSPTAINGTPFPRFSHVSEEVKHPIRHSPLAENRRERDIIPSNPPQGLDTGFMLHQYLELQSMIQLAMLQERANQVRCLTLDKPLTAFTSPVLTDLSPESRTIYGLSDISACHQLLSKLQQEEILQGLSSGVTLDGLLPLGLPYLGEASPLRGRLPLPPFYHQHLATKAGLLADGFLPGLFQLRPEELVFGNSSLLFAKHLELLNHLSDSSLSRPLQPYDAAPSTRGDTPDRTVASSERLSPVKPRVMHSPSWKQSPRSPVERSSHRRHHPYGRSESPSARSPVSSKSSPSYSRHSAFREAILITDTM